MKKKIALLFSYLFVLFFACDAKIDVQYKSSPSLQLSSLDAHLKDAVHDFSKHRPHCTLGLYTPYEVHYNCKPQIDEKSVHKQVAKRIKLNQTQGCGAIC